MKKYFLFLVLFLLNFVAFGQAISKKEMDKKAKKTMKKAREAFKEKKYKKAIKIYDKLLKKNPNYIDVYLMKSGVHFEMEAFDLAIQDIDQAIRLYPEYSPKMYSAKAAMLKEKDSYLEAALSYENYLSRVDSSDVNYNRIKTEILRLRFMDDAINNPLSIDPKLISKNITSSDSEYSPVLSLDGGTIIFTRLVAGQEDLYISTRDSSDFTTAVALSDINTPFNEGAHCISSDGNTIIYTFCEPRFTLGSCDLFVIKRKNGKWGKAQNFGPQINSLAWDSQPSLSANGKVLYFSSKRKGGYGGSDIWKITRESIQDPWSNPVNLGNQINTAKNEESPFLHPDGRTLFFRSDGHIGMGKFDLFRVNLENKNLEITNLGYPINTAEDEGSLVISLDGKYAYFASNRLNENQNIRQNYDLYYFELPEHLKPKPSFYFEILVKNEASERIEKARIKLLSLVNSEILDEGMTDALGTYINAISLGNKYLIEVHHSEYLYHSEHITLDSLPNSKTTFRYEIVLQDIPKSGHTTQVSAPIILKNIFFETGKALLKTESFLEIDALTERLKENDTLNIKIIGHTDNVGNEGDNLLLSELRAKAVYDALLQRGINRERLSFEGKGEDSPIDDNNTEEGKQNNRRTEFVLSTK